MPIPGCPRRRLNREASSIRETAQNLEILIDCCAWVNFGTGFVTHRSANPIENSSWHIRQPAIQRI